MRVMLLEQERKRRRDAQWTYLVTKIAIVEAMTGEAVDHGLFDDPEAEKTIEAITDAELASLGFVRGG
jgi:hypothetical protein